MSRAEAARDILANPLVLELLKEFEETAITAILHAKDDLGRHSNAVEARVIRDLVSRITVIAQEDQQRKIKQAPA